MQQKTCLTVHTSASSKRRKTWQLITPPHYNPRQTIQALVGKLRAGELSDKLKGLSDQELFGLVLDSYEAGADDTRDALIPGIKQLQKSVDSLSGHTLRLAALEGKLVPQDPEGSGS